MSKLLLILVIMALFAVSVNVAYAQTPPTTPTISTVAITSSPGSDNTYATGDTITVSLTFSEAVTVTGTPYVTIDIGGQPRNAAYTGAGTATGQILFAYTVRTGDRDGDGVSVLANSLTLNGGTIQATDDSTDAALTHAVMTFATHKVVTDSTLTTFLDITEGAAITISATQSHTMTITPRFAESGYEISGIVLDVKTSSPTLEVTGTLTIRDNNPNFQQPLVFTGSLNSAGHQTLRPSNLSSYALESHVRLRSRDSMTLTIEGTGSGSVELRTMSRNANEPHRVSQGWSVAFTDANPRQPRIALIGHQGIIPDIILAAILSEPLNGTAYTAGENIEFLVTFSIEIALPETPVEAAFWLGDGSEHMRHARLVNHFLGNYQNLVFAYTVQPGDIDTDGVLLGENPLGTNADSTITNVYANQVAANTLVAAVQGGANQRVDGSMPQVCGEVLCGNLELELFVYDHESTVGANPNDAVRDGQYLFFSIDEAQSPTPFRTFGALSATVFGYSGKEYSWSLVQLFIPDGQTEGVNSNPQIHSRITLTQRALNRLALDVGGDELFLFSEGGDLGVVIYWDNPGLTWTTDNAVSFKIVEVPVTATFDAASYTGDEGDTFEVTVTLGESFETKTVTLPLTATGDGRATDADYSGVPTELVFAPGETEKTFTVTVTDDDVDDDDESITLSFGTLPTTVKTGGDHETATITIRDDDDPELEVEFGADMYAVAEGGTQSVTVTLSADPERTVAIPVVVAANQGGATSADYSGLPTSVTFSSGETSKSFAFMATQDTEDDDGESVRLGFGTLPERVSEGATGETTVNIGDDDDPHVTVQFGADTYTVAEGGTQSVTVTLSADPERTIAIPVVVAANQGGATSADYSGRPASLTFSSGETSKLFTFMATQDTEDDDGESVKLGFGTLPARVSEGARDETTVHIGDDDDPHLTVQFGADTYAVADGGTRAVTVTLSSDPERTVAIPVVVAANQGGATSADYSGVPASVTFNAGQTSGTLTFNATDDTVDDDDESVKLGLGTLPPRVSLGARNEATVSITDDDDPQVSVSFGADTYAVARAGFKLKYKGSENFL